MYSDGSGDELLRYNDINDYIKQAEIDTSSALIKTDVEGDDDATAVSIIKPFIGKDFSVNINVFTC